MEGREITILESIAILSVILVICVWVSYEVNNHYMGMLKDRVVILEDEYKKVVSETDDIRADFKEYLKVVR